MWYGIVLEYIRLSDGFARAVQRPSKHATCAAAAAMAEPSLVVPHAAGQAGKKRGRAQTERTVAVRAVNPSGIAHVEGLLPGLYSLTTGLKSKAIGVWSAQLQAVGAAVVAAAQLPHPAVAAMAAARDAGQATTAADLAQSWRHPAWLTWGELALIRAAAWLFPVTDWSHPVLTPCLLLLAQTLECAPTLTLADAAAGVAAAVLALELGLPGGRALPEAVGYLHATLCACAPHVLLAAADPPQSPALPLFAPAALQTGAGLSSTAAAQPLAWLPSLLKQWSKAHAAEQSQQAPRLPAGVLMARCPASASSKASAPAGSSFSSPDSAAHAAVGLVSTALRAAVAAAAGYGPSKAKNPGAAEVLFPLATVLQVVHSVRAKISAGPLRELVEQATAAVHGAVRSAGMDRTPLRLQAYRDKVRALASLEPDFEDKFVPRALPKDPAAREAEEVRRLKRAVRQERRGVARELRRDAEFIARHKAEAAAKRDVERAAKYNSVMSELQTQAATFNQMVKQGQVHGGGGGTSAGGGNKAKRRRAKMGLK